MRLQEWAPTRIARIKPPILALAGPLPCSDSPLGMGYSHAKVVRAPLSSHRAFAPLVAAWLAAFLSGCIAVLPATVFGQLTATSPFTASQITYAASAALAGGLIGWIGARMFAVSQRPNAPVKEQSEVPEVAPVAEVSATDDIREATFEKATVEEVAVDEVQTEEVETPALDDEPFETNAAPEEPLAQDTPTEDIAVDETPHYADIDLKDLLGAPKSAVEDASQAETEAVIDEVAFAQSQPTAEESLPDEPRVALPQHGKAVSLLRATGTEQLAMPQLIERLAVALEDQRQMAEQGTHTYSAAVPPEHLTQRLRALVAARRSAA